MRSAVWGVVLGAGLILVFWGFANWQPALAQRPGGPAAAAANLPGQFGPSGEMIALSFDAGGGRQHITLIDPRTAMMSVYGIDPNTGEISLRSVRNVRWDLQMDEYNGTNPSPREIRSLLGNK